MACAVIAAGVQDGAGDASVAADGRIDHVPRPAPSSSARRPSSYTVQDARGDEAGPGHRSARRRGDRPARRSRRRPRPRPTTRPPRVTWGQAAANGSPIDDVEIQSDQVACAIDRRRQQLHVHRAGQRCRPPLPGARPQRGRMGSVERVVGAGHARHAARPTGVADGDVRRRAAARSAGRAPTNEGSAITGYELEIGGGATGVQALGNTTTYTWTGLANGVELPVPGRRPQRRRACRRRRRGRRPSTRCASPARPARRPPARATRYLDLSWARAADNGDPVIEYQLEMQSQPGVYVPVTATTLPLVEPAQRRRAAVPGAGPQPRRRLGRVERLVDAAEAVRRAGHARRADRRAR